MLQAAVISCRVPDHFIVLTPAQLRPATSSHRVRTTAAGACHVAIVTVTTPWLPVTRVRLVTSRHVDGRSKLSRTQRMKRRIADVTQEKADATLEQADATLEQAVPRWSKLMPRWSKLMPRWGKLSVNCT